MIIIINIHTVVDMLSISSIVLSVITFKEVWILFLKVETGLICPHVPACITNSSKTLCTLFVGSILIIVCLCSQSMYCWGNAQQGALGLGGIEELTVPSPKWNKYLAETNIRTVG